MSEMTPFSNRWRPQRLKQYFQKPISFGTSPWQWWIADDARALAAAQRMDACLQHDDASDGIETLRTFKGRSTYRIHAEDGDCFAKTIPLFTLRKRIGALTGHQNRLLGFDHGSAEVDNTLTLHEQTGYGLPVYCLGERLSHGLPDQQVLIQPWLEGWVGLKPLWQSATPLYRYQLLTQVEKLLAAFHQARIFHMDLHGGNLMVDSSAQDLPLRAIDCDKMVVKVSQPHLATALHIGKLLRELEGRDPGDFSRLLTLARSMQRRIVGDDVLSEEADTLLALSLRYRLSKNISRRRLVMASSSTIEGKKLESIVRRTYKNADMPFIDWPYVYVESKDADYALTCSHGH